MTSSTSRGSLGAAIWRNRWFYIFISPFFILFALFGLYPLLYSLYMSTIDWDGLMPPHDVGFNNFRTLFQDTVFYTSIKNTLLIGIYHMPVMMFLGFTMALLLNQQWLKLRGFWRAAVFVPCITPMVVIAIVFTLLFGGEYGLVNYLIRTLSGGYLKGLPWLDSASFSKITISILLIWRWSGYNMLIMLAGMQGIPQEMYEAATIDGANRWQQLRRLTIPMMRPTFVFCMITSLIGTVYLFEEPFVLTNGGPGTSSTNFGLFLFNNSFRYFRFGYASAAAYSVAVVVLILTLIIYRGGRSATD
jgi:ABC-type sugar transport system permease subunit